jgi:hypothetical protein
MARSTTVLAVLGSDLELALEARGVVRVVDPLDWTGPTPVDLERIVFGSGSNCSCRHVLVVRSDHEQWQIGTARELAMREVPDSEIHAVPPLVWPSGDPPVIRGVVILPDGPPLLVLDLIALRARVGADNSQGDIG